MQNWVSFLRLYPRIGLWKINMASNQVNMVYNIDHGKPCWNQQDKPCWVIHFNMVSLLVLVSTKAGIKKSCQLRPTEKLFPSNESGGTCHHLSIIVHKQSWLSIEFCYRIHNIYTRIVPCINPGNSDFDWDSWLYFRYIDSKW